MKKKRMGEIPSMILVSIFAFLAYSLFVAPSGPTSNGGFIGVGILVSASMICWGYFFSNRSQGFRWKGIKAVLATPITALAIHEFLILSIELQLK